MLPLYGPCSPQCFPLIAVNSQLCTWQPLIFWGYGRPYRRRPGFTPCQGFDVHAAIQMVPPILCGRWWVFHGNLPLQLTLVPSWTNNSSGLEKELKSEKEQRQALQRELQREKDTSCLLQTELQQVEGLKKVRWPPVGKAPRLLQNPLPRPGSPVPLCGSRVWGTVPALCTGHPS